MSVKVYVMRDANLAPVEYSVVMAETPADAFAAISRRAVERFPGLSISEDKYQSLVSVSASGGVAPGIVASFAGGGR